MRLILFAAVLELTSTQMSATGQFTDYTSCEVKPEFIVESNCKWMPSNSQTVGQLNSKAAYCKQKERVEYEKTHQRQDYFVIEANGVPLIYSLPNEQCKSNKFLVQGDLIDLIDFYPSQEFSDSAYARIIYFSKNLNHDVVGWVPSKTLYRLTASGGNCGHIKRR